MELTKGAMLKFDYQILSNESDDKKHISHKLWNSNLVLKSKKINFQIFITIYIIFIVVIFSSFYDPWVPSEQYLKKIEKKIHNL